MSGPGIRGQALAGGRDELDDLAVEQALALVRDPDRPPYRPTGPRPSPSSPTSPSSAPSASSPSSPTAPTHSGDAARTSTDGPEAHGKHASHTRHTTRAPHTPHVTQPVHAPGTPWPHAREIAADAARAGRWRRASVSVPLADALGLVLAAPLDALSDLPPFDTSAMDGWAVAGPGPWEVRDGGVLAGYAARDALTDGEAVPIATGARIPGGVTAVLRSEHGRDDPPGRLHAIREVSHGQDIRWRGQECRSGDRLLPAGTLVTPAVLGLAAAAGYDTVAVVPRPRAEILVLGDELLTEGLPHDGLIRDALGPMLAPWLRALGAEVIAVRRLGDDAKALRKAVTGSRADLIVTTGGTAGGPVDHVHPTLAALGAELLVDGVAVRPGHPMLLARIGEGRHLVGLPGNPLAAVSGLITLAEPLLRALAAHPVPEPYTLPLREPVQGHPDDTRLVPVALRGESAVPLDYHGPAMLRGVAAADALVVVPPGGAPQGAGTELLDLPWAAGGIGVCFT